jgi:hypothetical protein
MLEYVHNHPSIVQGHHVCVCVGGGGTRVPSEIPDMLLVQWFLQMRSELETFTAR